METRCRHRDSRASCTTCRGRRASARSYGATTWTRRVGRARIRRGRKASCTLTLTLTYQLIPLSHVVYRFSLHRHRSAVTTPSLPEQHPAKASRRSAWYQATAFFIVITVTSGAYAELGELVLHRWLHLARHDISGSSFFCGVIFWFVVPRLLDVREGPTKSPQAGVTSWQAVAAMSRAYRRHFPMFIAVSGMGMLLIALGSYLWNLGSPG